jgi:hypothetical protein
MSRCGARTADIADPLATPGLVARPQLELIILVARQDIAGALLSV